MLSPLPSSSFARFQRWLRLLAASAILLASGGGAFVAAGEELAPVEKVMTALAAVEESFLVSPAANEETTKPRPPESAEQALAIRAETLAQEQRGEWLKDAQHLLLMDKGFLDKQPQALMNAFFVDLGQHLRQEASKTEGAATENVVSELLQQLFAQGYQANADIFKNAREQSRATKAELAVPPSLLALKARLVPARYFFADELRAVIEKISAGRDALAQLKAPEQALERAEKWRKLLDELTAPGELQLALERAEKRRKLLDERLGLLQAFTEQPQLEQFFSRAELEPLVGQFQKAFSTIVMEGETAVLRKGALNPQDAMGKALELEKQLVQFTEAAEARIEKFRSAHAAALAAIKKGREVAVAGREALERSRVIDFPVAAREQVWLRAHIEPQSEPTEDLRVQVKFFLVRKADVVMSLAVKKRPGTVAPASDGSPHSATPDSIKPDEEIFLGVTLNRMILDRGRFVAPEGWSVRVDHAAVRKAFVTLGFPAWLAKEADAIIDSNTGVLTFTLQGVEPNLEMFGLEPVPLPPTTLTLNIYDGSISVQTQLLEKLRQAEKEALTAVWNRAFRVIAAKRVLGIEVAALPVSNGSPAWPRTIRLEKDGLPLAECEFALSIHGSDTPRVCVSGFRATEAMRKYFRETLLAHLRKALPTWPGEIDDYLSIDFTGPEEKDGPALGATAQVSFGRLQVQLEQSPVVKVLFRPLNADHPWEISLGDWQGWLNGARQEITRVLAEQAHGAIAERIAELGAIEFNLLGNLLKMKVTPVEYVPASGAYRIQSSCELGGPTYPFTIQNLLLLDGYDPATRQWTKAPRFDFRGASFRTPADEENFKAAVRNILQLPEGDGFGGLRLTDLHWYQGGLAFRVHLELKAIDMEIVTKEIALAPSGVTADFTGTLRATLEAALLAQLQKQDLSISGIGPVKSVRLDSSSEKTRLTPDVRIGVIATMEFMKESYEFPVQVYPDLRFDRDAIAQLFLGKVEAWARAAFKINIPGALSIELANPPFQLDPPRVHATIAFDVSQFFHIGLTLTIGQNGVELPEQLEVGSQLLAAALDQMVRTASEGICCLHKVGGTFYPREAGRFQVHGDLTFVAPELTRLLKVVSTLSFDLRSIEQGKIPLIGVMRVLDSLDLFESKAVLDMGAATLYSRDKALGVLAYIFKPERESKLDFKQGIFESRMPLDLFRMHIADTNLKIHFGDGAVAVKAAGNVDLLIGQADFFDIGAQIGRGPLRFNAKGRVAVKFCPKIGSAEVSVNQSRAQAKFSVLFIPLSVSVPSVEELTPGLLLDLIAGLFDFRLEDLAQLLKGKISIGAGHGGKEGDSGKRGDDTKAQSGGSGQEPGETHGPPNDQGNGKEQKADEKIGVPKMPPEKTSDEKKGGEKKLDQKPPGNEVTEAGLSEGGTPVFYAQGVKDKLPSILNETKSWLVESIDGKQAAHWSWARGGQRVWRVAIQGDVAYACPLYFKKEEADADKNPPRTLIPAKAGKLLPAPEKAPSKLTHDMVEALLAIVVPEEGSSGSMPAAALMAIRQAVAAGSSSEAAAKDSEALEVWHCTHPANEVYDPSDAPEGTADESAHATVIIKAGGWRTYFTRLKKDGQLVKHSFAKNDPLLQHRLLPTTEGECQEKTFASLTGQFARLVQKTRAGGPKYLGETDAAFYLYTKESIAVIERKADGRLGTHRLVCPKALPSVHECEVEEWQPIVKILQEEAAEGSLQRDDELILDAPRPARLAIIEGEDEKPWKVRLFARPSPAVHPTFASETADGGLDLSSAYQALGEELLARVSAPPEIAPDKWSLAIGCEATLPPLAATMKTHLCEHCPVAASDPENVISPYNAETRQWKYVWHDVPQRDPQLAKFRQILKDIWATPQMQRSSELAEKKRRLSGILGASGAKDGLPNGAATNVRGRSDYPGYSFEKDEMFILQRVNNRLQFAWLEQPFSRDSATASYDYHPMLDAVGQQYAVIHSNTFQQRLRLGDLITAEAEAPILGAEAPTARVDHHHWSIGLEIRPEAASRRLVWAEVFFPGDQPLRREAVAEQLQARLAQSAASAPFAAVQSFLQAVKRHGIEESHLAILREAAHLPMRIWGNGVSLDGGPMQGRYEDWLKKGVVVDPDRFPLGKRAGRSALILDLFAQPEVWLQHFRATPRWIVYGSN
ncbi:MAG: hypothetical protein JWL59_4844 [Chthoniobacteraceae bacterium]|nr:hypothetical protein [Chthoniobacteraceae bacterium]